MAFAQVTDKKMIIPLFCGRCVTIHNNFNKNKPKFYGRRLIGILFKYVNVCKIYI